MKLFRWALILVGGGLIVVGVRQTLKGFRPAEEDDLPYEPGSGTDDDWDQHLLDIEERERNAHTKVTDLNDGA